MRIFQLFENTTWSFPTTKKYNKAKTRISKSDKVFQKGVADFEKDVKNYVSNPTPEEKQELTRKHNFHLIKQPYGFLAKYGNDWTIYQAHIKNKIKLGNYVANVAINKNEKICEFSDISDHKNTG